MGAAPRHRARPRGTFYCTYTRSTDLPEDNLGTLFADRIRTAKQLNRTSGKILAEAREHPVTIVSEGAEPSDMTECWDRLAYRTVEDLPRTCKPLIGRFAKSGLRQYSVGPKQRVWYTVSGRDVTIREVHRTHPKATD